ncbi:hypothetical protein D3C79_1068680 [compost metagenome]
MVKRIGDIALDGAYGYAHLLGDGLVFQPIALGQQKGAAHLWLEPFEHARDTLQQLQ